MAGNVGPPTAQTDGVVVLKDTVRREGRADAAIVNGVSSRFLFGIGLSVTV